MTSLIMDASLLVLCVPTKDVIFIDGFAWLIGIRDRKNDMRKLKKKETSKVESEDEKYVRMALLYIGANSYEEFEDFARRLKNRGRLRIEEE